VINIRGELFSLEKSIVMAILNVTPDSFFDGGKYLSDYEILTQTQKFLEET
jgi:dihydropteroate synthase